MKKSKKFILIIASSVIGSFCLLYFLGGYVAAICVADALFAKRQSTENPSPEGFSGPTFRTREDLPETSNCKGIFILARTRRAPSYSPMG